MDDDYLILKEKIKLHLADYIKENHTDPSSITTSSGDVNFRCINPKHEDRNPSMFIGHRIPQVAKCRSCGYTASIFHVHNLLTEAPLFGLDFIEKNLNVLALKYGYEPVKIAELSEDTLFRMKLMDIHEVVCDFLKGGPELYPFISWDFNRKLGVSDKVSSEMGIGSVVDFKKFYESVCRAGNWNWEDLEEARIYGGLFGPELLTYTIHNSNGRPIAFAARDWRYDGRFGVPLDPTYTTKDGTVKRRPKWENSPTSLIYEKGKTLYGYHKARKYNMDSKVYVVEGYADAAVLWSYGVENVVCVGSTAFTPYHVNLLKEADKSIVIICLDNDEAGWKATDKILDEGFKNAPFIKPQILLVPETLREDGKLDIDPDTFIKAHGVETFLNLKPLTAFEYTISRIPDQFESDEEKDLFVQRFIPIIMNETSAITQQTMRKVIAEKIKVSETLIREFQSNLERIYDIERRERLKRNHKFFYKQFDDAINFYPEQALALATDFASKVKEELNSDYIIKMGYQEVVETFDTWKNERETADSEDLYWKTGYKFWDATIGGVQKTDTFMLIGGPSNHGKSCLLTNLCLGMLENNPSNLLILYWTIDDTVSTLYTKLAAIKAQSPIYEVFTYASQPKPVQDKIRPVFNYLAKLIKEHRLLVKGTNIGKSGDDLKKWVESVEARYPDKRIVLILDNFANMSGPGDELQTQQYNIEILHEMRCQGRIAIISTFEMNKEGFEGRSSTKNIRGSGKILYRVTRTIQVYNEHRACEMENNHNPEHYWYNKAGAKRPIVEINFGKSKSMSASHIGGNLYMQFEPSIGCLYEIGTDAKFKEFRYENNNRRRHVDVGLSTWNSTTKEELEAKAMDFSDLPTEEKEVEETPLTLPEPEQTAASPQRGKSSFFSEKLAHLDEDDGL